MRNSRVYAACSPQLRDELRREAQRLARAGEEERLRLERERRDLDSDREALQEEKEGVAVLRRELEDAMALAIEGKATTERERAEILAGLHEVRMALEVRERDGRISCRGNGPCSDSVRCRPIVAAALRTRCDCKLSSAQIPLILFIACVKSRLGAR